MTNSFLKPDEIRAQLAETPHFVELLGKLSSNEVHINEPLTEDGITASDIAAMFYAAGFARATLATKEVLEEDNG